MAAILSIYFYNLNVNLRYQIGLQEKALRQLETANGDLRNQLYQLLDSKSLSAVVEKLGLISDKNPDYLENKTLANRWGSDYI